MAAYILLEVDVENPSLYEDYKMTAAPTLAAHSGRFVVRGGAHWTLEGDWDPKRLVVLEFDSVEHARAWYASPEYTAARAIRQRASRGRMVLVEGYPE